MHYTIEALLQGKEKVIEYYTNAKGKWKELFDKEISSDETAWLKWVEEQASFFEKECGGRLMAPEIMAWSAFGSLYSIQFGWRDSEREKASKLVKAIETSSLSAELKDAAKKAAEYYALAPKSSASSSPDAV